MDTDTVTTAMVTTGAKDTDVVTTAVMVTIASATATERKHVRFSPFISTQSQKHQQ